MRIEKWKKDTHDQQAKIMFAKALRIYRSHESQPKFVKLLWDKKTLLSCGREDLVIDREVYISIKTKHGDLEVPSVITAVFDDEYQVEYNIQLLNNKRSTKFLDDKQLETKKVAKSKVCVRGELIRGEDQPVALIWSQGAEASDFQELHKLYRDDLAFQSEWNQSRTVTCVAAVSGHSNQSKVKTETQGFIVIGFADGTLTMWSLDDYQVCTTLNHANSALMKHPILGKWVYNPSGRLPGRWKTKKGSREVEVSGDLIFSLDPKRKIKLANKWYCVREYDRRNRKVKLSRPLKRNADNLEAFQFPLPNESIKHVHMSEDAKYAVTISESTIRAWKLPKSATIR